LMRQAKHFIGIRQPGTSNAFKELPPEKLKLLLEGFIKPVHYGYRNHHLNWVYLRGISPQMIDKSGLATEDFVAYYSKAILFDYCKLDLLLNPLKEKLNKVTSVRILGPGRTDLRFELGGFGVYKSTGKHNLPDGEIFTAPVKDSVNGFIEFNVDSLYYDTLFSNVRLLFNKGRVVEASSNDTQKLNDLLDVDEGARFVGEFALGVNPVISVPINDILFDEKMYGSLHLALGNAYPVADNQNRSAIHWDLILGQTAQYGGGEIYFDDQLIRKDGLFLTEELAPLNFK
jgi:aminopeptidase